MLRGGRLGNIQEDGAHFPSSRKNVKHLIETVLAINNSTITMIIKQNIIMWRSGTKILAKNKTHLELPVKLTDMVECCVSYKTVETDKVQGGLSHIGVERALKERLKSLSGAEKTVLSLETALSTATSNTLGALVGSCSSQ